MKFAISIIPIRRGFQCVQGLLIKGQSQGNLVNAKYLNPARNTRGGML